jgi:hypothetical protein
MPAGTIGSEAVGPLGIQTTGDIYADWDVDRLAATMAEVLDDDGGCR